MSAADRIWQEAAGQDRAWITTRIPHQGAMCLLDEVVAADPQRLHARCRPGLRVPHPLRLNAAPLGAAAGVEYASQAMALHGALGACAAGLVPPAADEQAVGGRLVSVRELQVAQPELLPQSADPATVLDVVVTLEAGDARQARYAFVIGQLAQEGRWQSCQLQGHALVHMPGAVA